MSVNIPKQFHQVESEMEQCGAYVVFSNSLRSYERCASRSHPSRCGAPGVPHTPLHGFMPSLRHQGSPAPGLGFRV